MWIHFASLYIKIWRQDFQIKSFDKAQRMQIADGTIEKRLVILIVFSIKSRRRYLYFLK